MFLIYFVVFLFFQLSLEISLVVCHHKETTKATTPITLSPPECDSTECGTKSTRFCRCANYKHPNRSIEWPKPKIDTCQSIGCVLYGKDCFCDFPTYLGLHSYLYLCNCANITTCNKKQCTENSLDKGCYCYFGEKEIMTNDMPGSNNCSDLLREVGDHNGSYQCSPFSCNCDQYENCVCTPPKNKNPETPKRNKCDYEKCQKRSFEFCQCTFLNCSGGNVCITDTTFKKLPKSGICLGMLNSSYDCKNVGQRCRCERACTENYSKTDYKGSNKKPTVCTCVEVDPVEFHGICDDNCQTQSTGSCICTYGELATRIPNAPKNCSDMEKSKGPNATKFDACPYREGQVCECERNPNTGRKYCICRNTLKRIPPFSLRSNPYECCNVDNDCIKHSELYCYCTNYVNNTYVKTVPHSDIANLPKEEFDYNAVEKLCTAYSHPPDTSCHPFGYKANCVLGFCHLKQINLYSNIYNTTNFVE